MLDVSNDHLKLILDILKCFVPSCEVRAFGSRCKWTAKDYSDLGLAIVGNEKIGSKIMSDIKEAFEESELPYRVDVLDWNAISEKFKKIINEKYEVIQKAEYDFDNENSLPDGWNSLYVKDVAKINEATIDKNYKFKIIEYIDIASVENRQIIEFQNYNLSDAPSRAKRIVKKNDILISTVRPNLKHFTILKNACSNTIASTGFAVVTAQKIDPYYLYYFLTTDEFTNYLSRIADSHTSTYPSFNPDIIENASILIPPSNEQKSIASILSSLDDKIELNRKMNETLEKMAQAIFKHWFIDFEFPDENGKPYKSNGGKMFETELGEIPCKWNLGFFSNIVQNLKIPLKPGNHLNDRKYVPIECLSMKKIVIDSFKEPSEAQSSLVAFEKNDILFGAMRAYFHRVNFAPFAGITRTTTFVLRPFKKEFFTYALFLMYQESSVNYANAHSKGTTMPYAVWEGSLSEMAIIIPDSSILNKFNDIIIPLIEKINISFFESIHLSQIRDLLLPKLMSGKIRVKA